MSVLTLFQGVELDTGSNDGYDQFRTVSWFGFFTTASAALMDARTRCSPDRAHVRSVPVVRGEDGKLYKLADDVPICLSDNAKPTRLPTVWDYLKQEDGQCE